MKKGDFLIILIIAMVIFLMVSPWTKAAYEALNAAHPYLLGFLKFALLATIGELIAIRRKLGFYKLPDHLAARAIIWGIVGVMIVFMFALFNSGARAVVEKGMLPKIDHPAWYAFLASALMNMTFGPVFMGAHRISDAYLENLTKGVKGLGNAVASVDWMRFFSFVIAKTIPFFWIPAHTITFLLPDQYRVLVAALLSIALGLILSMQKPKKEEV